MQLPVWDCLGLCRGDVSGGESGGLQWARVQQLGHMCSLLVGRSFLAPADPVVSSLPAFQWKPPNCILNLLLFKNEDLVTFFKRISSAC